MEAKSEYLEITAAKDGGKHKVAGLAYSGGKMRLFGWSRPVVVDLSGMAVPESVPLLANHENHTLGRVGVVAAKVADGHLSIAGDIVAGGELAEAIVAQGKAGADWQLSIGAEVEAAELVHQIKGCIGDGPLALDVALSPEAVAIKKLKSEVAGDADCLVFPNIESANVFYKSNSQLMKGVKQAAIVAGAAAPCVLSSRADSIDTKLNSIALAALTAKSK